MLELRSATKRFAGVRAVDGVSLSLEEGRTCVLLGPSGCGKSTILRLFMGLVEPDAGSVHLEGIALVRDSAMLLRRRMGYVVQSGGLFPHLCARDNVTLAARHLGMPREDMARRLDELRELARLPADALERYPAQLSGGQCQRVSLMRALMLDPAVLLLDEPLGALDPMIRRELQDELRRIFRQLHKSVVLVTHDLEEARFLGDRIVLMNQGRIEQDGTYEDLVERPASSFVERFVSAQRRPEVGG